MPRRGRDDGFSVLEVVFAAFIMFFVLTALFGLVAASMTETRSAGVHTTATHLADLLIEQARALDYASLGTTPTTPGGPYGTLRATETTAFGGMSFTIQRFVTYVDDPVDNGGGDAQPEDYKRLRLVLNWAHNGRASSVTFSTDIRDRSLEMVNPPTVDFTSVTPTTGAIVWNNGADFQARVWRPNGPNPDPTLWSRMFEVQASGAESDLDPGGFLTRFEFWVDGKPLRNIHAVQEYASWSPGVRTYQNVPYPVDSRSTDPSGTPLMVEGIHELKVQVYDNAGAMDFRVMNFIVDNDAPTWAGSLTSGRPDWPYPNRDRYNSRVWTRYPQATDGGAITSRFDVQAEIIGALDFTTYWVDLTSYAGTHTAAYTPFALHRISMRPRSPRGLTGSTLTGNWVLSNPKLTGATVKNGARANVYVTLSPPAGATLGALGATASYQLQKSASYDPVTGTLTGTVNNVGAATAVPPNNTLVEANVPVNQYYWYRVTLTDGTGNITTVYSNVIGPTRAEGTASASKEITVSP